MKFVAISILTTGFNPQKNDILEFGAVVEDTENVLPLLDCPAMRVWIDKEFYKGNPYALSANNHILQKICELREQKSKRLVEPDELWTKLTNFLRPHFANGMTFDTPITVAGKSFSTFDVLFLRRLKNFSSIPFAPRVIEPSNLFIDWRNDVMPPPLTECRRRLELDPKIEPDTLSICRGVIEVLRTQYVKMSLSPQEIKVEILDALIEPKTIPALEIES